VKITLRIWRQQHRDDPGRMVTYHLDDISPDMSFLEMLDVLNEQLMLSGDDPVAFDSACHEGICGACGLVINGIAHGPPSRNRDMSTSDAQHPRRREYREPGS
jgi:succinate dehydrogenase / fumarate reductase iron-sulfur subunit